MKLRIVIFLLLLSNIAYGKFVQDHIKPWTTDAYDLGTSSLEWRDLFLSRNLDFGTNIITDGSFTGDWGFNAGDLSGIDDITATGTITGGVFSDTSMIAGSVIFSGVFHLLKS